MAIEIKGFDDIFETLDDMDISDKKKRLALRNASEIVLKAIEYNSPKRSGKLKKSWKAKIRRIDGNLGFEIRGNTQQDIENEFGSSTNKKHIGFFSNAVDKSSNKAVSQIIKEVLPNGK